MKTKYILFLIALFLASCGENYEEEIISTYPEGVPMQVNHFIWKGNKKVIKMETRYYPNGEKEMEGGIKNGKKHGKWTYWNVNKEKWSEENFDSGIRHGEFTIWYKSGEKNYAGFYKHGKSDGKWVFWDAEGNKTKEVLFENGKKLKETVFD